MELKAETRRLQTEIDKINRALTEEEKNAVLLDPDDMDPMGYTCTKEVLELNEITYLDQLLCFNTTEEQCYKVLWVWFRIFFRKNEIKFTNLRYRKLPKNQTQHSFKNHLISFHINIIFTF